MRTLLPDLLLDARGARSNAAVTIESGRVVAVGPATGGERLPGRALAPGFVNAHSHAFQRALRGRVEGGDFWAWRDAMLDVARRQSAQRVRKDYVAVYREMLGAGYTAVGEFHYLGADEALAAAEAAAERRAALMAAFGYDDTVLLEQQVQGTALALSVVDGLPTLPAVEIRPKEGRYDFSARYTHGAADFRVPANLDQATVDRCLEAAHAAHLALGGRDISRVDAILDPTGTCRILEVNTGPGLTTTSLVPMAADAAGLTFTDLAAHLTDRAIARRPR